MFISTEVRASGCSPPCVSYPNDVMAGHVAIKKSSDSEVLKVFFLFLRSLLTHKQKQAYVFFFIDLKCIFSYYVLFFGLCTKR